MEHDLTPLIDDFGEIKIVKDLSWVQDGLLKVKPIKAGKGQDKNECEE